MIPLLVVVLLLGTAWANSSHTVQKGDTLYSLARKYNTTVTALRTANRLSSDLIRIGQVLVIHGKAPAGKAAPTSSRSGLVWATWYGPGFQGNRTAGGERFDMYALTAAHPTLPFGTRVKVTNPNNGKSVVVRINDRGPFGGKYVIDLTFAAMKALGSAQSRRVILEVLP